MNNTIYSTDATSTIATSSNFKIDGNLQVHGKIEQYKERNTFIEYEFRIIDLRSKETKTDDRILVNIKGTMELALNSSAKEAIILKHSREIPSDVYMNITEYQIHVVVIRQYMIER